MKKLTLILLVAFALSTATKAQEIIKINLAALAFTNVSLQGEHILNDNSSVCLGVSYLPSYSLSSQFKSGTNDLSKLSLSGFAITPEYRYYFSGNAPNGFYAAGYFRYSKYSADNYIYTYTNSTTNAKENLTLSGDWTVAGVGIMLGSQWKLGDHVVLDWWILGGCFGKNEGTFTATGPTVTADQTDIQKSLNDVDLPVGSLKTSFSSNSVTVKYDTGLPAIRGMGICLGYNFGK